ncbi:MAG: tRNA (pseudouridine(54)-N(1))-methyltransferase TrmY [Methanomicrobiales archaeon]|jgi:tRNA (pseudouridine54-N1)-methyltransferase|nr:tRNA (pseudouridine(54)-N(1))-methyltransferase TrmY [Methanomicrobiales archaeon]
MPVFAIIGHTARTDGSFSLNDLPGGAGRMDILCRCVNTSLFLSHDLRRDVACYLVLQGDPDPPKTVFFSGEAVRYLSPDERSAGSLIKKALTLLPTPTYQESTPGVYMRRGGIHDLLTDHHFTVLDEGGEDIRKVSPLPGAFLLSDHHDFLAEEVAGIEGLPRVSVGPRSYHADHAITVTLNEIDRRNFVWT